VYLLVLRMKKTVKVAEMRKMTDSIRMEKLTATELSSIVRYIRHYTESLRHEGIELLDLLHRLGIEWKQGQGPTDEFLIYDIARSLECIAEAFQRYANDLDKCVTAEFNRAGLRTRTIVEGDEEHD
jgi:hemerythrin-like domain-containing protein